MEQNKEIEVLEKALDSAESQLREANAAVEKLLEEQEELEKDLKMTRRWLRAWLGESADDQKLRNKLMDSAEFQAADPADLNARIVEGMKQLVSLRQSLKDAQEHRDAMAAVEREAYYALYRRKHRDAVRRCIEAEVEFAKLLAAERDCRDYIASRERSSVGSLPNFAHAAAKHFLLHDAWSMTAHRIRQAIDCGYLNGDEGFLNGVQHREEFRS